MENLNSLSDLLGDTIDLRYCPESEQRDLLRIAVGLRVAGWTAKRNSHSPAGSGIPLGEALLWEYAFIPSQFNGDADYARQLPLFSLSADAVLPLLVPFQPEISFTADGARVSISRVSSSNESSEPICVKAATLPVAACIALLLLHGCDGVWRSSELTARPA